jgi:hypothetical protein
MDHGSCNEIQELGYPPVRIDRLSRLDGVSAAEIWDGKVPGVLGGHKVFFIGRETYRRNKRAAGRLQDLADLDRLGESEG